jgi:hypothetical protein
MEISPANPSSRFRPMTATMAIEDIVHNQHVFIADGKENRPCKEKDEENM